MAPPRSASSSSSSSSPPDKASHRYLKPKTRSDRHRSRSHFHSGGYLVAGRRRRRHHRLANMDQMDRFNTIEDTTLDPLWKDIDWYVFVPASPSRPVAFNRPAPSPLRSVCPFPGTPTGRPPLYSWTRVLICRLCRAIGQILIMGWDGTEVTPQIRSLIEDHHLGSIILTAKNLKCAYTWLTRACMLCLCT